jgi:hypothetical protein
MSCWSTDSSAQCLRVEMPGEIHLLPYGYFQYAKLVSNQANEVLQIRFQECLVIVIGKRLEPLCNALARLAVDSIRIISNPKFSKTEGVIEKIEIHEACEKTIGKTALVT